MALDWLVRDNEVKDHHLFGEEFFGKEPPCTTYEKKPLINPATGKPVDGLSTAWVTLNNPAQYNSYTTEMVKGVIAGMHRGDMERDVQLIVFTGAGDRAFCTGGNTKEYAEYYSRRPLEYVQYMDLFSGMVDAAFNIMRQSSESIPAVSIRMLETIATIAAQTRKKDDQTALLRQAVIITNGCKRKFTSDDDRNDLEKRFKVVVKLTKTAL